MRLDGFRNSLAAYFRNSEVSFLAWLFLNCSHINVKQVFNELQIYFHSSLLSSKRGVYAARLSNTLAFLVLRWFAIFTNI